MIKSIPFSRAVVQTATLALGVALVAFARPAAAFTPTTHKGGGENAPLTLSAPSVAAHTSSGGASITRTIVGLLIVIAVIWGLSWILRQVKTSRETQADGTGLQSVATLPLGTGRSLHLVRAGGDYLLLGSAEHGVVPIYRYTEQQARDAGLLSPEDPSTGAFGSGSPRSVAASGKSAARFTGSLLDRLRQMTVRV